MNKVQAQNQNSEIHTSKKSTSATLYELQCQSVVPELLSFCKATAEQIRLDILRVLSRESFGVLELCEIFECKQSGISHHLKILANAGLVLRRREGNSIFYSRAYFSKNDELIELQKSLFKTISSVALQPEVEQRLSAIHKRRAENARQFFEQNANKFKAQQEQVADYSLYGQEAGKFIRSCLASGKKNTVLEIGPGEGDFLSELALIFNQVFALDNSTEMLNKAKAYALDKGLSEINFIEGDTNKFLQKSAKVDCVVMNMVLHHVPSPSEIFCDVSKFLNKDGMLFITELCSHDQSWVKESCGDLWLGFEPDELRQMAEDACLSEGESIYLAQRNGFRVQIRQFIKI